MRAELNQESQEAYTLGLSLVFLLRMESAGNTSYYNRSSEMMDMLTCTSVEFALK